MAIARQCHDIFALRNVGHVFTSASVSKSCFAEFLGILRGDVIRVCLYTHLCRGNAKGLYYFVKCFPKDMGWKNGRGSATKINCLWLNPCIVKKVFSVLYLFMQCFNVLLPVLFTLYRVEITVCAKLSAKRDMYINSCRPFYLRSTSAEPSLPSVVYASTLYTPLVNCSPYSK